MRFFIYLKPVGLMNRSNLGGFLVKFSGTKQTLVTRRFHDFPRFPVEIGLKDLAE
jgi:hypothetical protein